MFKDFFLKRIRNLFGSSLQMAAYSTGLMSLAACMRQRNGAIILMYHSIADSMQSKWVDPENHVEPEIFEQQMKFLSQNRKVVSFSELIATLQKGCTPPDGTVVITFDDGYLDNLSIAAPILEHYKMPALLFLPSAYIDRSETQWIDQAYTAFMFRSNRLLRVGSNPTFCFDLDNKLQSRSGYKAVCRGLLSAGVEERQSLLADLYDQLAPTERPPRLTMTWDDVRTLLSEYKLFHIGAHTAEHTDLTSVSEKNAKEELAICMNRIKAEVNIYPHYFSFCYNRSSESLRHLVAEAGFEAACGGRGLDPVIKLPSNLFDLPRIAAPASMRFFDILTNSVNTGIWRRLGR